jgi:hypothetical protein
MFRSFLQRWLGRTPAPRRPRRSFRPRLEVLEDRTTPSLNFAAEQTFATGNFPADSTATDLDRDGRPDLVAVNDSDNSVTVILNTTPAGAATASFAPPLSFATGNAPVSVAVADVNGDGRPDLIVANNGDDTVSVLLNTSAGPGALTFAVPQAFAVGGSPQFVAAADLNGDGRPDLVAANGSGGSVSILFNTTAAGATAASFAGKQDFEVGTNPVSIAVADLNGDGRPDLLVANEGFKELARAPGFAPADGSNTVSILLNSAAAGAAAPSFVVQVPLPTGNSPTSVAAGDVNGDGRPDVVVGNSIDQTVTVYLNTTPAGVASTTFAAPQTFDSGSAPNSVALADVDGDGRPDILVAMTGDFGVSVLPNTTPVGAATPSFDSAQIIGFQDSPDCYGLGLADLNGDGRLDVATANRSNSTYSVLLNGSWPYPVTTPAVVADFKGYGLYTYNQAIHWWVQLHPLDPSLLAVNASGEVVADFAGYGLYTYMNTTGWVLINGIDARAVAIDRYGNVAASFAGYGTDLYRPAAGWSQLNPVAASQLAFDGSGNVYAGFAGYGLNKFLLATGWVQLDGADVTALAVNALGEVAAGFAGYGTYRYLGSAGGWQQLSGITAAGVTIDSAGDVAASFPGYGSFLNEQGSGWQPVAAGGLTALDDLSGFYAVYNGQGIWRYDPVRGWVQLFGVTPTLLAVA